MDILYGVSNFFLDILGFLDIRKIVLAIYI